MKKLFKRIKNRFKGGKEQSCAQSPREQNKTKKKAATPPTSSVTCSKCGRKLKPIGSMFDSFSGGVISGKGNIEGFQQWLGWVCMSCGKIFCMDCKRPSMNQPMSSFTCPSCNSPLQAALAMNLKKIGKI